MTFRRLFIATFALAGRAFAGALGFLPYSVLFHPFDDPISLAGRHTEELSRYMSGRISPKRSLPGLASITARLPAIKS